jgi:hypothetical protein
LAAAVAAGLAALGAAGFAAVFCALAGAGVDFLAKATS